MTVQNTQRLLHLTRQLTDTLVTAAWCANEISTLIDKQHRPDRLDHDAFAGNGSAVVERPLVDQSTFSVTWRGKSTQLKNTRCFWLLLRLARWPKQYVTHLDLINDVWEDDDLTTATIRSTVCQLRRHLRRSGMSELASAIQGQNGHYVLDV